jgi:flagellar basal body-associated protein FliL
MFSSRNHDDQKDYPHVPESLRSDSVEMSILERLKHARASTSPHITPYLGLRARLSQIWINRWTILLLLVLLRLMLLIAQLNDNVGSAEQKALSACSKVEDMGSAMASMPHYLSRGVNDMAATGIESAVSAMVFMLDLILQGVEGLISFFISFLTGTYVCLITALVHGTLDVVASVAEDATEVFNKVIGEATDKISDIAGGLQDTLNDITGGIEDSIFGGVIPDIPKIDFSEPIDKLKDFDLNTDDFVKDVRQLNEDLPNFDEVKELTKEAISIPFDMLRKVINDSYGDYRFDRDVFPLAQKEQMTFCSDNDTLSGFFENLFELIANAKIIIIVVLTILAVAAMAPMAWLEIKRWRKQQHHARLIEQNKYDAMDVVYIASRPMTSAWGIKLSSRLNGKQQVLLRWGWAYATSPAAIFVLSLAIAGLFSCLCQVILLQAVKGEVPALTERVGAFADEVVTSISSVSDNWANEANGVITGLEGDINDDILGYVRNATDSVNDTLTTFVDTMDEGLQTVFNGTILLDPIRAVVRCVIGIKIENVQDGLTWVHDHAKVSLPLFPNDTFSMGAKDSIEGDSDLNTFLASPSSVTTDEVSGAVGTVTDWLNDNLVKEALISTGILLVYVIVVLLGVARMLATMAMSDKGPADGGSHYTGEDRPPLSPRSEQRSWERDEFYGNRSTVETGYEMTGAAGAEKGPAPAYSTNVKHVKGGHDLSNHF